MTGLKPAADLSLQLAKLQQGLTDLLKLAENGVPVEAAIADTKRQIQHLEAQLAEPLPPSSSTFSQAGQQIDTQFNIAQLYQIYLNAAGQAQFQEADFQNVLADYLDWVRREYGQARLHGLQTLQHSGPLDRPLAQVYTSLVGQHRPAVSPGGEANPKRRTGQRDPEELATAAQPVDMADLLALGQRVAIVGGAGSGKTTYLAFVAASLAAALRGEPLDLRLKPPAEAAALPVPLLAPLRFWQVYRQECAQVPGLRLVHAPDAGSLGAFLLWFLRARYKSFAAAGDFFDRLLRGGQGCLILLDGLDEVVNVEERQVVRDEVARLLERQYPHNRCLVTAREAGYRDAPFGSDFIRCEVQPMNDDQIATLVSAWCRQIYPQPGDRETAQTELTQAIGLLNRERVERGHEPLVTTPLLVTMVVSVKYSRRELPRERAKLYDACVDVVLKSEYLEHDPTGARRGLVSAGGPPDKQREWLSQLAFQMHQGGQAGASLAEAGLRQILTPIFAERGELPLLDNFVSAVHRRGGLLDERGGRFQFMHLTFQEYLAAQHLARLWSPEFLAGVVSQEWWREALLLTVGSLGAPAPYAQRRDFIEALCRLNGSLPVAVAAAELAATGLADLIDPEPALEILVRDRLVALLTNPAVVEAPPAARAAAGQALAILGDLRDFDELVTIPAGPFLMGSANSDEDAADAEKPQHKVTLPAFKIGRYPVTNAQYQRFVAATGREWASDEGHRPDKAACPATYVTWHDARAYCEWLTGQWRTEGKIGAGEEVRLPSEAEWEKAARGSEGRIYPWGDAWAETKGNTAELGLGETIPVGIFPDGASPYGCLDMAGNVFEWTSSLFKEYPYDPTDGREKAAASSGGRVVRGGSWWNNRSYARCADRNLRHPNFGDDGYGFRIIVSPISPPQPSGPQPSDPLGSR